LPFLDRHLLHQFDDLIRSKINRWHMTLNLDIRRCDFRRKRSCLPKRGLPIGLQATLTTASRPRPSAAGSLP
jgi:hypothetical protein